MSTKDSEWAYRLELPAPQKAVLTALAYCRNGKTGLCFPSHKELASMTGLAERTVRAALAVLADVNGPVLRTKTTKGGWQSNDQYAFNYEYRHDMPKAAAPPASGTTGHRQDMPEVPAPDAESGGTTDRAVELTGIQPEVEPESNALMLIDDLDSELASMPVATFDAFYVVWPKKRDKPAAQRAWVKATKRTPPTVIINAAIAYSNNPHRPESQFVPYPATWLNREGWTEELDGPPELRNRPTRNDQNLSYLQRLAAAEQNAQKGISA